MIRTISFEVSGANDAELVKAANKIIDKFITIEGATWLDMDMRARPLLVNLAEQSVTLWEADCTVRW